MKIRNIHVLAILAVICTAGTMSGKADETTDKKEAYLEGSRRELVGGFQFPEDVAGVIREATLVSGSGNQALFDMNTTITGATDTTKVSGPYEVPSVNSGTAEVPYLDGVADVRNVTINMEGGNVGELWGTYHYSDVASGTITHNISDGTVGKLYGGANLDNTTNMQSAFAPAQVYGVNINISGGTVEQIRAGNTASGGGAAAAQNVGAGGITINITGGTVGKNGQQDAIRGAGGSFNGVDGKVSINISGDNTVVLGDVYAGARQATVASTEIAISGGTINGNVYAGGSFDGDNCAVTTGDTKVTMTGGEVTGNVYGAGVQDTVKGSAKVELKGGTVGSNVYGAGEGSTIEKDVVVSIDGADVTGNVYAAGKNSTVKGNSTVELLSGNVGGVLSALGEGSTVEGDAGAVIKIGTAEQAYVGSVGSIEGFDRMVVSEGSRVNMTNANLFDTPEHIYTLSETNLQEASVTLEDQSTVSVDAPITLNFGAAGPLKSGRYMVIDATAADVDTSNWNKQNVTVNGVDGFSASFEDLKWVGNVLYFIIRGEDVDSAMIANWGVFKSSQAFVNTLWGNRTNCVVIKPVYDGKRGITTQPDGQTVAWGTVYGQGARISGVGADYELFGASVGAEHTFATGRSIGAAFGYDWGTVSPFGGKDIDQESMHLALYGRAGSWKAGQNGTIVLDWSAAYGNTTSETDAVSGDWDQNNIQLDARVSYLRQLRERTMGSVFAGLQYFAAEDSSVDGIGISSMQNVRAEVGVGVSHKATPKTTVYGEVSVYNDVMRHNPNAVVDGHTFYGTNPGRIGGTITAGAEYRLNEDWSLRGSYNFEVADDSVEHNINAGAIYKF